MFKVPERFRSQVIQTRPSAPGDLFGLFLIPAPIGARHVPLRCIAANGKDWFEGGLPAPAWEHVSVSPQPPVKRTPTWAEMCMVKDLFWDPEDAVIQIHPPEANYVNDSPFCLHLWRPIGIELLLPPSICVGPVKAPGRRRHGPAREARQDLPRKRIRLRPRPDPCTQRVHPRGSTARWWSVSKRGHCGLCRSKRHARGFGWRRLPYTIMQGASGVTVKALSLIAALRSVALIPGAKVRVWVPAIVHAKRVRAARG